MGDSLVDVFLKDTNIADQPFLSFTGESTEAFEPVTSWIGEEHLVLLGGDFSVQGTLGQSFSYELESEAVLCAQTGLCTAQQETAIELAGTGEWNGDIYLVGSHPLVSVPGLGTLSDAAFFVTTIPQANVAVLPGETQELLPGLTLSGNSEAPMALTLDEGLIPFLLEWTVPTSIAVTGIYGQDWTAIPEGTLAGIDTLTLRDPEWRGSLKGSALTAHLYGTSELLPSNEALLWSRRRTRNLPEMGLF